MLVALSLWATRPQAAREAPMHDFVAGSYAQLVTRMSGKPWVLAFWSLDCTHCPAALRALADLRRTHPRLQVVLVSTDGDADPAVLRAHVREAGLGGAPQWRFADPAPERLRLEIDSRWWGELPRHYLFNAQGQRTAQSGVPTPAELTRWWEQAQ